MNTRVRCLPHAGHQEHIQYDPSAHDKASTYALVISSIVPRPIALVSSVDAVRSVLWPVADPVLGCVMLARLVQAAAPAAQRIWLRSHGRVVVVPVLSHTAHRNHNRTRSAAHCTHTYTPPQAGKVNVAPYSYFNVMGHAPPVFCIGINRSPSRGGGKKDTLANIEATGCAAGGAAMLGCCVRLGL